MLLIETFHVTLPVCIQLFADTEVSEAYVLVIINAKLKITFLRVFFIGFHITSTLSDHDNRLHKFHS